MFIIDCSSELPSKFTNAGWFEDIPTTYLALILLPGNKLVEAQKALGVCIEKCHNIMFALEGKGEVVNVVDGLMSIKNSFMDIVE